MGARRWVLLASALVLMLLAAACGDRAATPDEDDLEPGDTTETEDTEEPGTEEPGTEEPGEADADRVLKVGLLNPTTGVFASNGLDTNAGFQMYLDEHDGVLAGWTIETVLEDDEGDPTVGATKARKLIDQDGVDIVIGGVSSAVAYGIADFIAESGVPYIITIAGADGLTQGAAQDNIFRISYTGSQPMHPLGEYVCNELGYETASLVSLDFAFGWETVGGFARTYEEAGCEVLQEIYVPLGTEDYAPFVQQIDRDAQTVMHVNSGPTGNLFWQTYSDFGYDQPVVGHGAMTDEFLLDIADDWQVGAKTVFYWSRALDTPANEAFVRAFEEANNQLASQGAEAGYAAAMVLEAALEIAGDDGDDAAALNDAIGQVTVDAPRGTISFDDYGQAVMDFYIREVVTVDEDPFGNDRVNKANVVIDTLPEVSQFWTFDPEEFIADTPYADLKGTWAP